MRLGRAQALRALWQVARAGHQPGVPGAGERLKALPRMGLLTLRGRYPGLSRARLAMLVVAAVYIISPVDLVPELLVPFLGLGDDALVLTWLAGTVLAETGAFLDWDRSAGRSRVVAGQVVT